MTRSRPAHADRPQSVPNGPRSPIVEPGPAWHNARLTAPTSRMVWVNVPSVSVGSPLTEIAISPIPDAYSIMNCPGRAAGSRSVTGSSTRVTESRFSATRDRTRWDTGAIASATGAGSGAGAAAGVLSTVGRMIGTGVFGVDRAGAPGPQPVQRPHLLGDVDSGGAPGDTAPAPHTAGTAELIVPGAQFVGEPVPVPGRAGLPHHPAVNVGE